MRLYGAIALPIALLLTSATLLVSTAKARTSARNQPTYLIHGINLSAHVDCKKMWAPMVKQLRAWKLTGPLVTVRYYWQDSGCSADISNSHGAIDFPGPPQPPQGGLPPHRDGSHTVNAPIEHLAWHLAWHIYDNYSRHDKTVDVVAHSMGGLVIRYALAATAAKGTAFPPKLLVEDVVTLGTPQGGARGPWFGMQGNEMTPGSDFIDTLARAPLPQGVGGTDWLTVGSDDDTAVPADRAVGTDRDRNPRNKFIASQHKVWYTTVNDIEHSDYYKIYPATTHAGAVAWQALAGKAFGSHVAATVWPVRRTYLSLISGKT